MIRFEMDNLDLISDFLNKKKIDLFLVHLNEEFGKEFEGIINIQFVNDAEIRRLNRIYRKKDSVTDVLSFTYPQDEMKGGIIGDVVISLEQARRQSVDEDLALELGDLLVHGVLHVLGFDHELGPDEAEEMFSRQDKFVNLLL